MKGTIDYICNGSSDPRNDPFNPDNARERRESAKSTEAGNG
jgi:hypothetical protein